MGLDENSNEMHVKNENLLELRKKYYDGLELIRENIKNYIKGVRKSTETESKQEHPQTEEGKSDATRKNTGQNGDEDKAEVFFAINKAFIEDGLVPPEYYLQSLDKNESCDYGGYKMFENYFLNISEKQKQKCKPGQNWRFIEINSNNSPKETIIAEYKEIENLIKQIRSKGDNTETKKAKEIIDQFNNEIGKIYPCSELPGSILSSQPQEYFNSKLKGLREEKYAKLKKDYQYLLCYAFRVEHETIFEVYIFIKDIERENKIGDPKGIFDAFTKRKESITKVLNKEYFDVNLEKGINGEHLKKINEEVKKSIKELKAEYIKKDTAEAARIQLMGNFLDRFRLLSKNQLNVDAIMDTFENALRRWVSVTEIAMIWGYVYHFPNLLIGPLKEKIDKLTKGIDVDAKERDSILYMFDIVSAFVSFANEIEYTIQLGWNNAVNAFMTELVNHEANTGNDWNKVLDDAEACIFFTRTGEKKNILNNPQEPILQNMVNAFKDYFDDIITPMRESMIKTALAAVIGRNMSHNIGSHVLSRLVSETELEKIINPCQQTLSTGQKDNEKKPNYIENTDLFCEHTPVKDISWFLSYLKSRMDYVANIITSAPTLESPKRLLTELFSELNKNNILLNRISGVDNFTYSIDFRKKENGEFVKINKSNDIFVSIPNDVLGYHAFFVIIENLIRNYAKHGRDKKIKIMIDIQESNEWNDFYKLTIYSNSKIDKEIEITVKEIEFLKEHGIEINNNDKKINELDLLAYQQNILLNESIIKDGALRMGGWGIIEMAASAAYLRKIPIANINNAEYRFNPKYITWHDDKQDISKGPQSTISNEDKKEQKAQPVIMRAVKVDTKYFGYNIFMMKPKEVLIIGGSNKLLQEKIEKDLNKYGITVIENISGNDIYPHKLVVIVNNENNNTSIPDEEKSRFSRRIVNVNSGFFKNKDIEKIITDLWDEYLKNIKSNLYYYPLDHKNKENKIYNNNKPQKKAYYSDHGIDFEDKKHEYQFIDIKTSATSIFMPPTDDFNNYYNSIRVFNLLESQFRTVVILDERIQQYAENAVYTPPQANGQNIRSIPIKEIYEKTNILVPISSNIDLNHQNYSACYDKILTYLSDDKDFFIIHLGVIEKLIKVKNTYDHSKTGIENFISQEFKIDKDKIIITSGRGTPHNLPAGMRYLNYSIISQYLIDLRFKYLLTEALYSARRIH